MGGGVVGGIYIQKKIDREIENRLLPENVDEESSTFVGVILVCMYMYNL